MRPRHSHSIILSQGNVLDFKRKFFLSATKNRLPDPSEIRAFDFKQEFRRSVMWMASATIGIDRSIFLCPTANQTVAAVSKKTVTML